MIGPLAMPQERVWGDGEFDQLMPRESRFSVVTTIYDKNKGMCK